MHDISYIILYRDNGDMYREENLRTVLRWIFKNKLTDILDIIVVEQDSISKINLSEEITHIFVKNTGPFNRSWGFNVGAFQTESRYLIFSDSDIIMPLDSFLNALSGLRNYDTVKTYKENLIFPSEEDSNLLRETLDTSLDLKGNRPGRAACTPFCGGVFFITQEGFQRIGGWDEEFEGWGGEDEAIESRIYKFLRHQRFDDRAFHLFHQPAQVDPNLHRKNVEIMHRIFNLKGDELEKYCSQNLKNIGKTSKYEK